MKISDLFYGNQINIFSLRYITPSVTPTACHLPLRGRQLKAPSGRVSTCRWHVGLQPKAVGGSKSEGAKPRRRECIAVRKSKIYIEKNKTKFDETLKRYILPLAKSELWLIMP